MDESFEIGQLRHFNETIYQPWATAADLAIHLTFSDPAGVLKNFAFTFQINETFNLTGHSPADDDFIYFPSTFAEEVFEFRGISGTLELLGFGTTAGNLVPQFQSAEGTDNAARLWGRITAPVQVPAPGAVLLGALGLAIAGSRLRRPAA